METPRQDRWKEDEFLTAGVRAAREDDRRRAQAEERRPTMEQWAQGWADKLNGAAPQTIDITPVGCQTPEGNARVLAAQQEWDSATHLLANTLKELLDSGITLHRPDYNPPDRESMHQINALIGARDRKQEAFLRAVAGR
jgi:S-ribosylhomocysteine lyase LuxS involved in autoinducer biosynthesis